MIVKIQENAYNTTVKFIEEIYSDVLLLDYSISKRKIELSEKGVHLFSIDTENQVLNIRDFHSKHYNPNYNPWETYKYYYDEMEWFQQSTVNTNVLPYECTWMINEMCNLILDDASFFCGRYKDKNEYDEQYR